MINHMSPSLPLPFNKNRKDSLMMILFCQMSVVGVGDPHRENLDRLAGQPETQDVPPAQTVYRLSRL